MIGSHEPEGTLAELATLVERRDQLEREIATVALDAQY